MITTGRDLGLAEWIIFWRYTTDVTISFLISPLQYFSVNNCPLSMLCSRISELYKKFVEQKCISLQVIGSKCSLEYEQVV